MSDATAPDGDEATDAHVDEDADRAGDQTIAIPPPARDLPAGVDPSEYADAPAASAPRGKLRRRLRYLRRVRDLLLRDLGGFTFELHRTVDDKPTDSHRTLIALPESSAAILISYRSDSLFQ